MNTTMEALKSLYTTLGGKLTDTYSDIADNHAVSDYVTIPDMLTAVAKIMSSGGAGLPEVTDDDNDKVLSVVEGAWAKADAPKELPDTTAADNGKVLSVVAGQWAMADPSGGGSSGSGLTVTELEFSNEATLGSALRTILGTLTPAELGRSKLVIVNAYGNPGQTCTLDFVYSDSTKYAFVATPHYENGILQNGYDLSVRVNGTGVETKGFSILGDGMITNDDIIIQGDDIGGYLIY